MTVLETMLRFTAAWLAVGLGLFMASGALRAMAPLAAAARPGPRRSGGFLALVPFLAGLALVILGLVQFVRVVPW